MSKKYSTQIFTLMLITWVITLTGYTSKTDVFLPCYPIYVKNLSSNVTISYVTANGDAISDETYGPSNQILPGEQINFGFNETTFIAVCLYFSSSPGGSIKLKLSDGTLIDCTNVSSTPTCFFIPVPPRCQGYVIEYSSSSC